jgi:hypothetical protein
VEYISIDLESITRNIKDHIEERANEIAAIAIDEKTRKFEDRIIEAEATLRQKDDLLEVARLRIARMEATITRTRAGAWKPKAVQSRPFTAEQEADCAAGNARVDWPTWTMPCDPKVAIDGDTLWITCTGDDRADSESPTPICSIESGDKWSTIEEIVAEHRCGTKSPMIQEEE